MRFHFPSFLLGFAAGAGTMALKDSLRPVAVEVAAAGYRFLDTVMAKLAMQREDVEDIFAEARARARGRGETPKAQA